MENKMKNDGQQWSRRYVVRGRWPFPTDMLRYDRSEAYGPLDRAVIDKLSADEKPAGDLFDVQLRVTGSKNFVFGSPTTERWRSFMWSVVSTGSPTKEPA
jgi:hypothetical protein